MTTYLNTSITDASVSETNGLGGPLVTLEVTRLPSTEAMRVPWRWAVKVHNDSGVVTATGDDLDTLDNLTPMAALRDLHGFLEAWQESKDYAERFGGGPTECGDLFPDTLYAACDDWDGALTQIGYRIGAYEDPGPGVVMTQRMGEVHENPACPWAVNGTGDGDCIC